MTAILSLLLLIGSALDFVGHGTLIANDANHPATTCRYAGKARRFPVHFPGVPDSVVWQLGILESEGRCVLERSPATVLVRQVAASTGRVLLDMPGIGLFTIEPRDAKIRDFFARLVTEAPGYGFQAEAQTVEVLRGEHVVQFRVLDVQR